MLRFFKRRSAIKWFVTQLPMELQRRFGSKRDYPVDEVNRARQNAPCGQDFAAYCHALFCSRKAFEEQYGAPRENFSYDALRRAVSKRFFGGSLDFDATSIFRWAQRNTDLSFEESNIGESGGHS